MDYLVIEPCKTAKGFEVELEDREIDLDEAEKVFDNTVKSPVVILFQTDDYEISIYKSGRILLKGDMNKNKAEELTKEIVQKLEEAEAIKNIGSK